MINATIKRTMSGILGLFLVFGFTLSANAQDRPAYEGEFVFFIDGVNVLIPSVDGSAITDTTDSSNKVFEITYGDWAEKGFRWPNGGRDTSGVDLSAFVGDSYGESDTLFFRIKSDPANGEPGRNGFSFLSFFDTDTGIDYETDNLPFRARWTIPTFVHDGEWHEFALPLPPATLAGLDSAKAGLALNGDSLQVETDSLLQYWGYTGAWSNPGPGGGEGIIVGGTDPKFEDFDWESVKYAGIHFDWNPDPNGAGGSFLFDYIAIGRKADTDVAPAALASISAEGSGGVNTISWTDPGNVGGFNVYFSESEITDVTNASLIATVAAGAETSVDHTVVAPHPDFASDFQSYYAVTATSAFGAESAPTTQTLVSDVESEESYAYQLSEEEDDFIASALGDTEMPAAEDLAAIFPDGYTPFTIGGDRKIIENGGGGDNDADVSGKFWIGFNPDFQDFIVYAEIMDDSLVFGNAGVAAGANWDFDSWEMGLGNYTPPTITGTSVHTSYQRGAEPDYQFRAGMRSDTVEFTFSNGENAFITGAQTLGEVTDYGYRLLTLIPTGALAAGVASDDVLFSFPTDDELAIYPMNIAVNDNDATARDTQVSWSRNAGSDSWWNNPTQWTNVAFVGKNRIPVSNEDDGIDSKPLSFELDQNYPNPFNPTTNISFKLATSSNVTLEVYNLLGQKVATILQNQKLSAGSHIQKFDASSLASGMYVYRISTESFTQSRKMMLIK